jgi:hypothetical protein
MTAMLPRRRNLIGKMVMREPKLEEVMIRLP